MIKTFPEYFTRRSILIYLSGLILVSLLFSAHSMPWYWIVISALSAILFFTLASGLSSLWANYSERRLEQKIFWITVALRLIWIVLFYLITKILWNTPWEQPEGVFIDSSGYYETSTWILELARNNNLSTYFKYIRLTGGLSDCGYPIFLAIVRLVTGNSPLLSRVPNAFLDAGTVVFIYRLARRNFGDSTGKIAAIFTMLMPTLFYFSATTMKESLMIFLMVFSIEIGDRILRRKETSFGLILSFALVSLSLFLFRNVLAITVVLSFVCGLILTSERLIGKSKRLTGIFAVAVMIAMTYGGSFAQQLDEINTDLEKSEVNFEYRATRTGGNSLVSDLSKLEFAPMIFSLPFPTMVSIEDQQAQQLQNGGNFVKNILSFFCILGLLLLLINKEWKGSVITIACLIGYLIILTFSSYAQSARFHMPAVPFEMIFAAYGVTHFTKVSYKHWFNIFLVVELLIILWWNWFKLKGRGLI